MFKRLNRNFVIILFKSQKDKSFCVSPEPTCLHHLTGFTRLSTWALLGIFFIKKKTICTCGAYLIIRKIMNFFSSEQAACVCSDGCPRVYK